MEKFVYNLVKKNAYLKGVLVKVYQLAFCGIGLLKGKIVTSLNYQEIKGAFFGFHDRSSMNKSGDVLSHHIKGKFENGIGEAQISVTNIHTKMTKVIASTKCCNYQQGSLLTWFSNSMIIFNDISSQGPVTVIKDIVLNTTRELPFHFFSISPCSNYLSSINFCRFGKGLDGYGYDILYPDNYLNDAKNNISASRIGDFFLYSLVQNSEIFRLSIVDAKSLSFGLIENGYFYFSHSSFSPLSDKVYFLLRSSNTFYNSSQLFCYCLKGEKLMKLPTGGMVSHLSWLSNDEILAFCNTESNQEYGYYCFNVSENSVKSIRQKQLQKDGHPHSKGNHIFYTDTYPDRERRQHLYKVNTLSNNCEEILSLYSPLKYRGVERVDLHPRLSMCGQYLTIDSSHNNDRTQIILTL